LNIAKPFLGAAVAVACALPGIAAAQGTTTDAYALDGRGVVWKNPSGLCWRTSAWTPAKAIAECDPDLVPKPAAPKPAAQPQRVPAPAPAPVPVPVPAPVPPPDSDRDGVIDSLDKCPGTVAGAKVDAQGCELDSDRDGVVDRLDKCPGTRAGAKVDANGCELQEVTVLKGVNFATNSATLTPQSMTILDQTAATLSRNPDVRAEVAGHTDSTGSAVRNRVLSQQRAESVVRYLVSKGANPANLTARGYGPDQPVADNKTAQGRSANRRVELRILK
jgi:outer membrane protein OmpA-like peptidoglycan-associated protein